MEIDRDQGGRHRRDPRVLDSGVYYSLPPLAEASAGRLRIATDRICVGVSWLEPSAAKDARRTPALPLPVPSNILLKTSSDIVTPCARQMEPTPVGIELLLDHGSEHVKAEDVR